MIPFGGHGFAPIPCDFPAHNLRNRQPGADFIQYVIRKSHVYQFSSAEQVSVAARPGRGEPPAVFSTETASRRRIKGVSFQYTPYCPEVWASRFFCAAQIFKFIKSVPYKQMGSFCSIGV